MASGNILGGFDHDFVAEDFRARGRMRLDDVIFRVGQALGIVQDGVGNADLPDVVQQRRKAKVVHPLLRPPERLGNPDGILAHAGRMALGIGVLGVDGIGQGLDCLEGHLLNFAASLFRHGRLARHLDAELIGVINLEQRAFVVLVHDVAGDQPVEKEQNRKTVHDDRGKVPLQRLTDRRIEGNDEQQLQIEGRVDALLHTEHIADRKRNQQGPEEGETVGDNQDAVGKHDNDRESCRDDRKAAGVPDLQKIDIQQTEDNKGQRRNHRAVVPVPDVNENHQNAEGDNNV